MPAYLPLLLVGALVGAFFLLSFILPYIGKRLAENRLECPCFIEVYPESNHVVESFRSNADAQKQKADYRRVLECHCCQRMMTVRLPYFYGRAGGLLLRVQPFKRHVRCPRCSYAGEYNLQPYYWPSSPPVDERAGPLTFPQQPQ